MKSKVYNFLKWSEKYTKTDMVYLVKGGSWIMFGEIISSIFVLGLAIAFANLLPKETYGTYKYILSLAGIFSFFTLAGMNNSLIQSVARGYEKIFTDVTKTKIKYGFIGSFISVGTSLYYYLNENMTLAISLLIVGLFIPFFDSFNIYTALLNGRKRFDILTKYKIVSQLFVSLSIVTVLFLTNNLFVILFSYFVLWLLVRILFYFRTIKNESLNDKVDDGAIPYGKHLSFMGILKLIGNHLDKILLWHFVGPIELAIYFFSVTPVNIIRGPLRGISSLSLPKLSSGNFKDIRKTFPRKVIILFLFIIPIVGVYILLSPYIFKIIFPQYLDSIKYSQIFALTLLLIPSVFINQMLVAHKKTKELYWTQILLPSLKIVLFLIFLPVYGLWGAIYTILVVQTLGLLLNLLLVYKNND